MSVNVKSIHHEHFLIQCIFRYSFHGALVQVTARPYMPYWDEKEMRVHDGSRTIEYHGSDYRLLETVATALNFTVQVLPTSSWAEVSCVDRASFVSL